MDYLSNAEAVRSVVRAIENDVIPNVSGSHARGQLWACAGLLGNIANELAALPVDANRDGAVGTDLNAYLAEAGLSSDTPPNTLAEHAVVPAAERLEHELGDVLATHTSLHYRRAVDGFSS